MTTKTKTIDKAAIVAGLQVVVAIGQVIRELKQVPSGELYARVMGSLDLESYEKIIDKLVALKFVEKRNHLLVWIGE